MFMPRRKSIKKKTNFGDIQEKAMNWIWVVLLISAIIFLRGLLSDMNTQTNKLAQESERLKEDLTKEREKSKELYEEFYAELNESIKKALESLNKSY